MTETKASRAECPICHPCEHCGTEVYETDMGQVRLVATDETHHVAVCREYVTCAFRGWKNHVAERIAKLIAERDEARRERDAFSYDSLTARTLAAEKERDEARAQLAALREAVRFYLASVGNYHSSTCRLVRHHDEWCDCGHEPLRKACTP